MNDFIKRLMELCRELDEANGIKAIVVVQDIENLYNEHINEVMKKVPMPVSNVEVMLSDIHKSIDKLSDAVNKRAL